LPVGESLAILLAVNPPLFCQFLENFKSVSSSNACHICT
jgi:hypothetical protein